MNQKILIGSRYGGHAGSVPEIKEALDEEFEDAEYIILTDPEDHMEYNFAEKIFRAPGFRDTGQDKAIQPLNLIKNFYISTKVILKERPSTIVPAGANTSFPVGLIGGLIFRKNIIAVEAVNRTVNPSKTPSVLSRLKNCKVWVSYDSMLNKYNTENVENKHILQRQDYSEYRSNEKTRDLLVVPSSGDSEEILEKHGMDLPQEEFFELLGKTKTVVTRAGNTAYEAANLAENVVVVPFPDPQSHQDNFADWLEKEYENVEVIRNRSFQEVITEYEED